MRYMPIEMRLNPVLKGRVRAETDKAILVELEYDKSLWIPKSQVKGILSHKKSDKVCISRWWAEKEDLWIYINNIHIPPAIDATKLKCEVLDEFKDWIKNRIIAIPKQSI